MSSMSRISSQSSAPSPRERPHLQQMVLQQRLLRQRHLAVMLLPARPLTSMTSTSMS